MSETVSVPKALLGSIGWMLEGGLPMVLAMRP